MKYTALGKITAPVGIKGEMRVYSYLNGLARFSDIREIFIGGTPHKLSSFRIQNNGMAVIRLEDVPDRNAAEALRNAEIFVPREALGKMPPDTYLTEDITGMSVTAEDGRTLGVLAEVISRPAQDLYRVEKPGGESFLIPAVKEFIKDVDPEKRQMTVSLIEGLEEL